MSGGCHFLGHSRLLWASIISVIVRSPEEAAGSRSARLTDGRSAGRTFVVASDAPAHTHTGNNGEASCAAQAVSGHLFSFFSIFIQNPKQSQLKDHGPRARNDGKGSVRFSFLLLSPTEGTFCFIDTHRLLWRTWRKFYDGRLIREGSFNQIKV
jgi:hypothetical protein